MSSKVRIVFLVLIALAAAVAVTAAWMLIDRGDGASRPTASGKSSLGGAFTLVNQDGKTVTEADFRGKYLILFFGFTNCPDVCPTTLQLLADAYADRPVLAERANVVLVSVDPERDTPEAIKAYVNYFDARFQALTGTPEQIGGALKAYGVYAKKVPLPDSALGYTMDHTSFIYLYGPDGVFVTAFEPSAKPDELAKKLDEATD